MGRDIHTQLSCTLDWAQRITGPNLSRMERCLADGVFSASVQLDAPKTQFGMAISVVPGTAGSAHSVRMNSVAPSYQHFKYTIKKFSDHMNPLNSRPNSLWNRSTSNTSTGRLLAMYASNRDWCPVPENILAKRSNNFVISSNMVFPSQYLP